MSPAAVAEGTLHSAGGRHVLRIERRLAHPIEKVWRAITEPAHLAHWFPADMTMELRRGAAISFTFRNGEWPPTEGTITELDPPRLFEFTWDTDTLRWELEPHPRGCLLVFLHTFVDRAGAASFASGWEGCFEALELDLDGRPDDALELLIAHEKEPGRWAAIHDAYVERFGLADGTAVETADGWLLRFERQMTRPVDQVWAAMIGPDSVAVGQPPPAGLTAGKLPGEVTAVSATEPTKRLEHTWLHGGEPAGRVSWEVSPGPGGGRVTLTQTLPAALRSERAALLAVAHTLLDLVVARLRGDGSAWPERRAAELERHYAGLLG
jgi:uncharacterized protein YndB with AHSA1/START domain